MDIRSKPQISRPQRVKLLASIQPTKSLKHNKFIQYQQGQEILIDEGEQIASGGQL